MIMKLRPDIQRIPHHSFSDDDDNDDATINPNKKTTTTTMMSRTQTRSTTTLYQCLKADATTANRKKSVSFLPYIEIKYIPPLSRYTDEERNACWFSEEECQERRDQMINCLSSPLRQDDWNGVDYTSNYVDYDYNDGSSFRGLENYVIPTDIYKRNRQIRIKSIEAVLEEQFLQKLDGIEDQDKIARRYRELAHDEQLNAYLLGVADEREAQDIF